MGNGLLPVSGLPKAADTSGASLAAHGMSVRWDKKRPLRAVPRLPRQFRGPWDRDPPRDMTFVMSPLVRQDEESGRADGDIGPYGVANRTAGGESRAAGGENRTAAEGAYDAKRVRMGRAPSARAGRKHWRPPMMAGRMRKAITADSPPTIERALDEAAADYAGRMIDDGEVLDRFIEAHKEKRTLQEKVRDAIRAIVRKLTGVEKKQAQTAEGKLTAALEAATRQAETLQGKAPMVQWVQREIL